MKMNYEKLLDSAILFFCNQDNLLRYLIKNMIMSKLGSNIKACRSYQKIFDELLSKLVPNNIHQKKDYYNQSTQFDEKKAFEDFMNKHNNGGIFQKFLFIPKETTIFCNKCRMCIFKFFYDKFILIKDAQNLLLSQKLFKPEIQNNQKVMCSFCSGSITDCSMLTKILCLPEVLIVIIEPNQANYFQLLPNLKISDGKSIEYKLCQFIEINTNYFYVINPSNSNLCHKFNDKNQYGNGEQVQQKKPIVLFYCLNKNPSFNANTNANLNNPNIQNQQIFSQNKKKNMIINNQIPAIISQQQKQVLQNNQQMIKQEEVNKILCKGGFISSDYKECLSNNSSNNEIINLKKELEAAKETIRNQEKIIEDLKNKLNISNNTINDYKNKLQQKEAELNILKIELQSNNKISNNVNIKELMCVNFISTDQNLHYAVPCLSSNTFAEVEEKLYQQFPEFRETNNNFIANGETILRFKTILQNKIGNGFPVTLVVP